MIKKTNASQGCLLRCGGVANEGGCEFLILESLPTRLLHTLKEIYSLRVCAPSDGKGPRPCVLPVLHISSVFVLRYV